MSVLTITWILVYVCLSLYMCIFDSTSASVIYVYVFGPTASNYNTFYKLIRFIGLLDALTVGYLCLVTSSSLGIPMLQLFLW